MLRVVAKSVEWPHITNCFDHAMTNEANEVYTLSGPSMKYGRPEPYAKYVVSDESDQQSTF